MGGERDFLRRSRAASPERDRRHGARVDDAADDEAPAPPSRLTRALRSNRFKDDALVATLVGEAEAAPWQKQQAWLQAVRELGGERATAMWARAFGVPPPAPTRLGRAPVDAGEKRAAEKMALEWAQAKALPLPGTWATGGGFGVTRDDGAYAARAQSFTVRLPNAPALALTGEGRAASLEEAVERLLSGGLFATPPTARARAAQRLAIRVARGPNPVPGIVERFLDSAEKALAAVAAGEPLTGELFARVSAQVGTAAARAARLHTDRDATALAAEHGAQAVTYGTDVFFGEGQHRPGTPAGDHLIAHELAHVAQALAGRNLQPAARLESGGALSEAEAEAELAGRLVVNTAPYPQVKLPAAPRPEGLPDDEGERAQELAAQAARLQLAETAGEETAGTAPLPPGAPGTPGTIDTKVTPLPKSGPPPATPSTGASGAYTDVFAQAPSKQAESWDKAGDAASKNLKSEETKFAASVPPMPVNLDGNAANKKGAGAAASGAQGRIDAKGSGPNPPSTLPPMPTLPGASNQGKLDKLASTAGTDKQKLKDEGQKLIRNLATKDAKLKTSPGPAAVVELSGDSDPAPTAEARAQAVGQSREELQKRRDAILKGPGAAQVQPLKLDEKLQLKSDDLKLGPMPTLPKIDGMQKFMGWQKVDGAAKQAFDTIARPKLDASLAPAKEKMLQAGKERESKRTDAVADAQRKSDAANAEARQKQANEVAGSRAKIAAEQQKTLAKQQAAVSKLEDQSNSKRKELGSKIESKVQADQQKIETQYQDAGKRAEAEQQRGEEEARRKREEAEREAANDSWWDQAVHAVTSAIEAVASAIDRVLDAVASAVGGIIDTVKNAALGLIEAARGWINAAIDQFGSWLHELVNATLGQLFPELAAALNHFIDQAVAAAHAAVNYIADHLKAAVAAFFDGLKASLNAIIAGFRAAVHVAAAFATALVTGDWAAVGRMLLEGILQVLGIDPAAFYALIGRAEATIQTILDNPGAFVGHLIDSVKQGFQQFGRNFLHHLAEGFMQWLFGALAGAGITMPARFDIAGIFDLVCQVLGLTYPRLRQKAVRLIGERNVERIEFVWRYVQELITGGWAGLWERIQQDLSQLQSMVVDGIKNWLMERIVVAAITRLATMWNPAGAIINLIMTAWNVYQWIRENAQRIFGLIQAVVDSMSEIAAGNITRAANFVENALARLVPVAISLLANLLGLSGISDRIREIIDRIQGAVDRALDRLIERVLAMFRGGSGKGDDKESHEDVDTPKALAEPHKAVLHRPNPALMEEARKTAAGTVLYTGGVTDPKQVTKDILQTHADAKYEKGTGTLTLPRLSDAQFAEATSLRALAEQVGRATGVSKVIFNKSGAHWGLDVQVNPTLANLVSTDPTAAGAARLQPLIDDIVREQNRVCPQKEVLLAICRDAANRHRDQGLDVAVTYQEVNTTPGPRRPTMATEVTFTEQNPPAPPPQVFRSTIATVSDNLCPACNAPVTAPRSRPVTRPHSVISSAMWGEIIRSALNSYGIRLGGDSGGLLGMIIGAGTGTGGSAVTEDRQCPVCEQNQNYGSPPHSLIQRQQAADRGWVITTTRPGASPASTPGDLYVGEQYADMTQGQQSELTRLKIEQVVEDIRRIATAARDPDVPVPGRPGVMQPAPSPPARRPSNHRFYERVVDAGLLDAFLARVQQVAEERASAGRARSTGPV